MNEVEKKSDGCNKLEKTDNLMNEEVVDGKKSKITMKIISKTFANRKNHEKTHHNKGRFDHFAQTETNAVKVLE